MGVVALYVAGKGSPPYLQVLVAIVLIVALYFGAREYFRWRNGQ